MRYMFLIYSKETEAPPDEAVMQAHWAVMDDAAKKGVLRGVDPLQPTSTATTIRTDNGTALVTDGPFAETKEQLAGYYIIDCRDLDEAIAWAKRIPTSCKGESGCIEIRPIAELPARSILEPIHSEEIHT